MLLAMTNFSWCVFFKFLTKTTTTASTTTNYTFMWVLWTQMLHANIYVPGHHVPIRKTAHWCWFIEREREKKKANSTNNAVSDVSEIIPFISKRVSQVVLCLPHLTEQVHFVWWGQLEVRRARKGKRVRPFLHPC